MRSALALVVLAAVAGCGRAEVDEPASPVAVRCVETRREAVDQKLVLRGRLAPPPGGLLGVASQVAGRVTAVDVHEGQHVASGDVVAHVDEGNSRDALRQATAARGVAVAADVNARILLRRARALAARGIAAQQELDDAIARAAETRAGLSAADASVALARRTLGRVAVRTSFAGVVIHVWRGPGALVDASALTPIVELAASGAVELVAEVTGAELALIRPEQAAEGALTDDGTKLTGRVRARSSALDPTTGLGSVRVALAPEPVDAPIGAFGSMVVITAHREGVITLPTEALRGAVLDGAEVVVCKEGKAELRAVQVGYRDDARIEVLAGVTAGERVAVDHVLGLYADTPLNELP